MTIPTEPIGSIPRPAYLLEALGEHAAGRLDADGLDEAKEKALVETINRLEETGSPVVTDGEQGKPSFATYPLAGLDSLAPDGVVIPFADGHTRQLPRLTAGPFRYQTHAAAYLREAKKYATRPVKQAVIAASAVSLVYPGEELAGYSKEQFIADLVNEAEADIRGSLDAGADSVQIDFTEGRLSLKLDPSGGLLQSFVDLNNAVLERFSEEERKKIGVHTCPGGDQDSVHSLDVDYAELLPTLFQLKVGNVYVQLASEADPERALGVIAAHSRPEQRIFVGVTDPIDPRVETAEEVRDRVLQAARYIPAERLGTCDDCGFSPFADDTSTSREIAFAKIAARVEGTRLAAESL
ncbi:cobalamin-independent methionine synthase II family protein [Amycolatopsis regifaucium]|uniref:5-methyltetrahydropteroyltriglutamate--homocysteine methyltransferase n=1 Tax=Amycolatopsis regifaucium TaxID=546365 RepID=A0A154MQ42_9PSEU|nr:cobalamin-independent methionine synthase II family protein [Amycolatopsis regifaucium]KZB86210.1 5-methyltetrahydropteroyltriglutamate--homocysteine methyltransferase [Amycolatopsis regifaucium]OKA05100.1 5-methyltetrahydropteroyltriglutamate--homocysteine methyltransferase [Amycolatopsis regifaucium]SFH82033.1 5-methyltetrahydropteroyltriglutamate--homocysteine methyltransferase [Amycolatopsis regifaucium]